MCQRESLLSFHCQSKWFSMGQIDTYQQIYILKALPIFESHGSREFQPSEVYNSGVGCTSKSCLFLIVSLMSSDAITSILLIQAV
jgi:hypothetical protein